jgi:hypothetical protein
MFALAAFLLLSPPPKDFADAKHSVTIDKVVWYDEKGQKHVTDQPYLQIRLTVTNQADHPLRWPGFHGARVVYGTRYVGGAVLPVKFGPGPGCRWESSLVTGAVVNPGQVTTILVVFDRPRTGGNANLELQWKGESPGWNMTVKSGFRLPAGN